MKITEAQLKRIMPNVSGNIKRNKNLNGKSLTDIVALLNKYAEEFNINSPVRWANYLAQIAHESAEFLYTEEIHDGSNYEGRRDLGNTRAGDGKKYKGRGVIQLTGKANYIAYRNYCHFDVVTQPELLAMPVGAIRSSMWYWSRHNLNYYADINAFLTITKIINGGTNGFSERLRYFKRAKVVFGIS